MRNWLRSLLGMSLALTLILLTACSGEGCPAVEIMSDGTYTLTLDISDEFVEANVTIAQKNRAVCLESDDGTVLLFTADGCWLIDPRSKTYSEFTAFDLNYNSVYIGKNTLKYKGNTREEGNSVYQYLRGSDKGVDFVYDSKGKLSEIRTYYNTDEGPYSTGTVKVISLVDTVSEEAIFEIPEGYVYATLSA